MHRAYLKPVWGVEDLVSSLKKSNPEIDAAQVEAAAAAKKVETLQQVANTPKTPDPRDNAQVGDATVGGGEEGETGDTGAKLPDSAPLPPKPILNSIDSFWFMDNFGMTGREMSDLLIKTRNNKALDAIQPLLKMEKQAILSNFIGVSPNLIYNIPLTDRDYDCLNNNTKRLDLPFRRFVKSWESSGDDGKVLALKEWRKTVDEEERLSNRERNILSKCREIIHNRGALNAQTLKTYGVKASPAEISSLIKSHGFLFDIISVGQFSKSQGRGLFYDIRRRDVLLKDSDMFLAGLLENGAVFKMDALYNPRIEIQFNAPSAPWYASALKKELDVSNIEAKGKGLLISGEIAVKAALSKAEPHLNGHSSDAIKMLKAMKGDKDALLVMAYDGMKSNEQMKLLKKYNLSDEDIVGLREMVMSSG